MTNSVKDRINQDLQRAKAEGGLRADRIREIVRTAVAQTIAELKAGSGEVGTIAKDALAAVIETVGEKGKEAREEITASVDGIVDGISESKREQIARAQAEVDQLQAHIDRQEQELENEVDGALMVIEKTDQESSTGFQAILDAAINAVRERQEFAGLRQQYAKLRAKLAVLDANLAARYGERYEEVKHHLDNAKTWYDSARANAEAKGVAPVQEKQTEFESKMAAAGAAVARKERQIKQRLQELWHEATKL